MGFEYSLRFAVENPDNQFDKCLGLMKKLVGFYTSIINEHGKGRFYPFYCGNGFFASDDEDSMKRVGDIFDLFPQYSFIIYNNSYEYPTVYRYQNKKLLVVKHFGAFALLDGILGFTNRKCFLESLNVYNEFTEDLFISPDDKPDWLDQYEAFFEPEEISNDEFEEFKKENSEFINSVISKIKV